MLLVDVTKLVEQAEYLFKTQSGVQKLVIIHWRYDGHSIRSYGNCRVISKGLKSNVRSCEITLSRDHIDNSSKEGIWNTVCHELCHAYNLKDDGHGYHWRILAGKMSEVCKTDIHRISSEGKTDLAGLYIERAVSSCTCLTCGKVYYQFKKGTIYKLEAKNCRCPICGASNFKFERYK